MLIGNSGVGKSSLAQAGVLAALKRQAWPGRSRAERLAGGVPEQPAMVLPTLKPGAEPIKALVEVFSNLAVRGDRPERADRQVGWIKLRGGKATLAHLIEATERAARNSVSQAAGILPLC